jgi:Dolichyl-phosphate-mannose-protein mannosyltransferase
MGSVGSLNAGTLRVAQAPVTWSVVVPPRPPAAPFAPPRPVPQPRPAPERLASAPRQPRWRRARRLLGAYPLLAILCLQVVLSLRLVWRNTAFQDEALYLWAGHLEWAHWLHGTKIPNFPTYFSGAPVLYPPLGALADSVGGLAGARILSLGFMLAASALLWGTASRLFDRRAAFFATAMWVVLSPTLHLGAFATYDPMSLCLMAAGAWCAVRVGPRVEEMRWVALAAVALVLANATKYASALFDPVVVVMVAMNARSLGLPAKAAAARAAALGAYVIAGVIFLAIVGGGYYEAGIGQTTITRVVGNDPASVVFSYSWAWIAPVVVIGLLGVVVSVAAEGDLHRRVLLATLLTAAALAPLQQARIHTLTSLDKHVDFGAWFAAIVAGYAARAIISLPRGRWSQALATLACAAALIPAMTRGSTQSVSLVEWPNAAAFNTAFGRLVASHPGRFLVETPSIPEYYLPSGSDWRLWSNTRSIVLPNGHSISAAVGASGNPLVYRRFIQRNYFSLVALDFLSTRPLDLAIAADLDGNSRYRLVADVPYGTARYKIWERIPPGTARRLRAASPGTARRGTGRSEPTRQDASMVERRGHHRRREQHDGLPQRRILPRGMP